MKSLMKLSLALFAAAMFLGLTTLTQADDADLNKASITLDGVSLGTHVLGPKLEADDLRGKVVVFEYWGDQCPPCIASIPSIVKLRSQYNTDELAIVANQVWTEKAEQTKKAWKLGGGDDSVTVINHGGLKGVAPEQSVPNAYVLDHTGKKIWEGNPHPRAGGKQMKKVIKKAVAAMP